MSSQQDFLRELLADFKIEASEHYKAIVAGLLVIEKGPENPEFRNTIERTFREVHSLKGAARAVNLGEIERLCQSLENVFHALKLGKIEIQSVATDVLFKALDALEILLQEIDHKEKSVSAQTISSLMKKLEVVHQGKFIRQANQPVAQESPKVEESADRIQDVTEPQEIQLPKQVITQTDSVGTKDTVRISVAKLEKLLLEAEEFITLKSALKYQIEKLAEVQGVGFSSHVRDLERYHRQMSRMVDDLLLDIKTTLLLPFSSLLEVVPRIIRDLSKEFGKKVNLVIQGAENEIDRRILEELKDPVIHLIRNCIDHGIESIQIREKNGKPATGTIRIRVEQESGSRINLYIEDDGAGLNKAAILQAAIKNGVIPSEGAEKLQDQEVFALIFKSGISTSPFITDISGRGLGMAIVAEKVFNLGGTIQVESSQGKGTGFLISLPVTLSTFKGILVRLNRQRFIVPVSAVESAFRVYKQSLMTVEGQGFIHYQGENVGIYRLDELIGMEDSRQKQSEVAFYQTLIVTWAQRRVGFIVDEIFGEQEGTVKSLGNQLAHVRHLAGAIILGNGSVVPILNVQEIMDTVVKSRQKSLTLKEEVGEVQSSEEGKKILIAEDSITLRSLLRNIIESAGYQVKTAVDGLEAFQFLTLEDFDLLVSDVEMPRLNGFGLTARVRSDKRLAELPVILVTALDTHEDRQRGMEAGANAYIVKGSFEQSNLLETIKRLL
jgi:two-component system chemotaxis sensor kinase CheA